MLNPEAAKQQLEKLKSPTYLTARLAGVAGLCEALRPGARTLFSLDVDPSETAGRPEILKRREKALAAFHALSPEKLEEMIRAVFPDLAIYILRALRTADRLPYTSGWSRKPFRAKSTPALFDSWRMSFLVSLFTALKDYPADIEWIAAWAPHAWPYNDAFVGPLLAAAIDENDAKGQRVFEIILASAKGEHEVGQMGRHVVRSLLICARPEAWEFMEKMLLAAQREEGLRQSILEFVDEGHQDVFPRFLRLALEHDLVRFSATVRAIDVWFGFLWDAMSTGNAKRIMEQALRFLDDPEAGDAAIAAARALPDPAKAKTRGKKLTEADEAVEPAYIALWTRAFTDVGDVFAPAAGMLQSANPDVRFVATHMLCQLELTGQISNDIAGLLDDPDERVAARALLHFGGGNFYNEPEAGNAAPDLFERLERLISRAPENTIKLAPIVWPWMLLNWGKETVGAAMIWAVGERPATRLLPYLSYFDARTRCSAVGRLAKGATLDTATRRTLLELAGDASRQVRDAALEHFKKCPVTDSEAPELESLLTRKASDLRRAVITLLLNQNDASALVSAERLTAAGDGLQRLAGLELLRQLAAGNRAADACRERATAYRAARPKLSADERTQLDSLAEPSRDEVTLDNCLGLIDPSTRTKPLEPKAKIVRYFTPASIELLKALDELVHEHREKPLTPRNFRGEAQEPVLLGNARWEFSQFNSRKPISEQLETLAYKDIWLPWFESRPKSIRDDDGFELIRAKWLLNCRLGYDANRRLEIDWMKPMTDATVGAAEVKLRYQQQVSGLVTWLMALYPPPGQATYLLDGLENMLAMIPKDKLAATHKREWSSDHEVSWRSRGVVTPWINQMIDADSFTSPQAGIRYYHLSRWIDEPGVAIPRERPRLGTLLAAYSAAGANDSDIYDHFLRPRGEGRYGSYSELGNYCSLKPDELLAKYPALKPIIDRCRTRVLEVEITRGETPTCVSNFAASLRHSGGLDVLIAFMSAAEKNTFARGHAYGSQSKAVIFSHIIRTTYPAEGQTPEAFSAGMKLAGVSAERLLELSVYAPQWAEHVEHGLQWPHLQEAVWWFHAHTRDRGWSVEQSIREKWTAQVAQRTPLPAEDLLDGAVDVGWFRRVHQAFGKKRWAAIYDVAKFAASGGGHKRAQLFADAMLGQLKSKELVEKIEGKRNQDAVRALGLLPLPAGDKAKAQMLSRYQTLQEFIRTARQFGSMRQTSEKRAAAIGMENLARTAGFPDPIRLAWSMESHACADLAKGPVAVTAADATVSLSINDDGEPEIACIKKGKRLAAIPPAAKKNPKIAELAERKTELKRSRSRMRAGLEQAMVRGDVFRGEELKDLTANPLLAPMLKRLVFVGEEILGYPVDGGRGLADHAGKIEPVKKNESLRLAHPHDLLATKHWSDWQHDCFKLERVQPFKQIFRELYLLNKTESAAIDISRRYAGHQVQPRQALALLGSRGWVTAPEEGVFRTFHELGLTAWVTFQEAFFTPADIEGLTLEGVRFTQRSKPHQWTHLDDVPPRIFSEVMRDLDLVVSVAHRGGVDPEASASTVQMRTSLLSETMQLLGIRNVRIKDSHAFIKGELAEYTLHLGSAVTHRQPGGALFIVPVHSQHRGRMFLPFADDDPKTAEVISKALLLARDNDIKDPNLLAQIRAH